MKRLPVRRSARANISGRGFKPRLQPPEKDPSDQLTDAGTRPKRPKRRSGGNKGLDEKHSWVRNPPLEQLKQNRSSSCRGAANSYLPAWNAARSADDRGTPTVTPLRVCVAGKMYFTSSPLFIEELATNKNWEISYCKKYTCGVTCRITYLQFCNVLWNLREEY